MGTALDLVGQRKDGTEFPIDHALSFAELAGEFLYMAFATDITDRKRAEEELRICAERYLLVDEHAQDMISRHTPEGTYLYASSACRTLLGYEPAELVGHSAYEFFHPDDMKAIRESHSTILEQPVVYQVSYRIRRKDGEYIWFETNSKTILDPETGAPQEIIAVSRNITERKRAEEALAATRDELEGKVERQMVRRNPYGLTFREFTVLNLVAAGKADKEIALELGISLLTVHKHVGAILGKMHASSRTDAAARALREGVLE
jgi:PAS domain S-box-containing protein